VSVAGRVRHDEVAAAVEERFAGNPGGAPPVRQPPSDPSEPVVVVGRPTEQAHLALGMRCISRGDDDRWAFSVLNQVLGGGMSSRLFQKIREQRGLAYSIGSERLAFEDAGSLCVVAGTAPERAEEVLSIVAGELGMLAAEGVRERELAVAKGNLRAEVLLAIEDSGARMSRVGSALLLHGEVKSVEEILYLIESVSREDVQRAAQRLAAEPRTLAVVGPFGQGHFDHVVSGLAAHLS
jgi:predicted Zn-dependent peptidase